MMNENETYDELLRDARHTLAVGNAAEALVHATLALAEQQRIANVLAFAKDVYPDSAMDALVDSDAAIAFQRRTGRSVLTSLHEMLALLRPEVRDSFTSALLPGDGSDE